MRIDRRNGVSESESHAKRYAWDVFITHAGLLRPRPKMLSEAKCSFQAA